MGTGPTASDRCPEHSAACISLADAPNGTQDQPLLRSNHRSSAARHKRGMRSGQLQRLGHGIERCALAAFSAPQREQSGRVYARPAPGRAVVGSSARACDDGEAELPLTHEPTAGSGPFAQLRDNATMCLGGTKAPHPPMHA